MKAMAATRLLVLCLAACSLAPGASAAGGRALLGAKAADCWGGFPCGGAGFGGGQALASTGAFSGGSLWGGAAAPVAAGAAASTTGAGWGGYPALATPYYGAFGPYYGGGAFGGLANPYGAGSMFQSYAAGQAAARADAAAGRFASPFGWAGRRRMVR